jgi:hypothetical protein
MEIILEIRNEDSTDIKKISKIFESTKYGTFCLN